MSAAVFRASSLSKVDEATTISSLKISSPSKVAGKVLPGELPQADDALITVHWQVS